MTESPAQMPTTSCRNPLALRLIQGGIKEGSRRRRRRLDHRQGELFELGKVVPIIGGDRAPREPEEPHDEFAIARDHRVAGPLDLTDEALLTAEAVGQLGLGHCLPYPPFRQTHRDRPSQIEPQGYFGPLYLVNGHSEIAGAEYLTMTYSVLVMRPGNRLRIMRKAAGLRQAELAERSGSTQEAISNYENGRRPLTLDWMKTFARELGCTVADLLEVEDNPDRLDEAERKLIGDFRQADGMQREMITRVAEPAMTYRAPRSEDKAA